MAATATENLPAPTPTAAPTVPQGAQVGTRDKSVGWYTPTLETVDPAVRDLFENYSHVEPDKVLPFILEMRDRAWEIFPYPCIGQFRFIDLSLSRSPAYQSILTRLRDATASTTPTKLLDLGCCVAQDLRKLVHDGAPADRLYGAELEGTFIDMGYELFGDRATFGAHLVVADIFDGSATRALAPLEGEMDMVHAGLFLHLFDWAEQVAACERIVAILRPVAGALVVGQQMGTTAPGRVDHGHRVLYKHDAETFKRMWAEVGERTGTRWEVRARLDEGLGIKEGLRKWDGGEARRLIFEVERQA